MVINKRKNRRNRGRWLWLLVPVLGLFLGALWSLINPVAGPMLPMKMNIPQMQPSSTTGAMRSLRSTRVNLDVAFVFDTTGSMGDELAQLQNNVLNIAGEIAQWGNNVDVRYGLVAYRDRGDEYVTQVFAFTESAEQFQANLMKLSAGGGGDTPEDLSSALEATLHQLQWRSVTDTIQLVFAVTDASAKLYGGFTYMDSVKEAAQRGIKIHSLAASGLDDTGEYMLRQASQITMGRFIFLTYDGAAPNPGSDRRDLAVGEAKDKKGIGEYRVEQLPQLVIRLIREEVEYVTLIRR